MIYKRGKIYWYKFMWSGDLVRESTKQGNDKVARQMESAHRTSLARGEVDLRDRKAAPALSEFLSKDFLPYTETTFATKSATARYYRTGARSLSSSALSGLRIDEINGQHAAQYAARLTHLSPSTVNCGLRTLRRALYLATDWGRIDRRPKITLAKGERQRERVLTDAEVTRYLEVCEQPWRDVATIMLGTGMRPGEVFALRWERVLLNGDGGLIQISQGKTKAARRVLPMVPAVFSVLESRWVAANKPTDGWLFPSMSKCGHFEGATAKGFHARALKNVNEKAGKNKLPELKRFEPYVMRHTALTRLGEAGCDAFTLARIAGHSSITITQRYVHPQAEAIERAFAKLGTGEIPLLPAGGHNSGHSQESHAMKDQRKATASHSTDKD